MMFNNNINSQEKAAAIGSGFASIGKSEVGNEKFTPTYEIQVGQRPIRINVLRSCTYDFCFEEIRYEHYRKTFWLAEKKSPFFKSSFTMNNSQNTTTEDSSFTFKFPQNVTSESSPATFKFSDPKAVTTSVPRFNFNSSLTIGKDSDSTAPGLATNESNPFNILSSTLNAKETFVFNAYPSSMSESNVMFPGRRSRVFPTSVFKEFQNQNNKSDAPAANENKRTLSSSSPSIGECKTNSNSRVSNKLLNSSRQLNRYNSTSPESSCSDEESSRVKYKTSSNSVDFLWLDAVEVDENGVNKVVKKLNYILENEFEKDYEIAWLLRAVTCIDLTTLSGDDTTSNVKRLCYKAAHPLSPILIKSFEECLEFDGIKKIQTAAVCVYPAKVSTAALEFKTFKKQNSKLDPFCINIGVASVATGFPSGQYPLETRLKEIRYCIKKGATEIDVVINRELVICGKWKELYDEIHQMKKACTNVRPVQLKTILATGECGDLKNIYKASMVAMLAGSDFIKTSTGKEAVNATLQVGVVMCRAIQQFHDRSGKKVGLKPAGGIRTSREALAWLILVKEILGKAWLNSNLFRIGASGLLGDIEKRLFFLIKGYHLSSDSFFSS